MEVVDYMEKQAEANGRTRLEAVALLRKRAHELTLLLLGGAGGLGAYGLGKLGTLVLAAPFLAASVWAFALAALVAWTCLRSRPVWPLHNAPAQLWQAWGECLAAAEGDEARATHDLRLRELARVQVAIDSASRANADLARWLNRGYAGAALLPLPAFAGLLLAWALC